MALPWPYLVASCPRRTGKRHAGLQQACRVQCVTHILRYSFGNMERLRRLAMMKRRIRVEVSNARQVIPDARDTNARDHVAAQLAAMRCHPACHRHAWYLCLGIQASEGRWNQGNAHQTALSLLAQEILCCIAWLLCMLTANFLCSCVAYVGLVRALWGQGTPCSANVTFEKGDLLLCLLSHRLFPRQHVP